MFLQSEKLAKELASRGIAANTVAPSAIETDIASGSVRDNKQVNDFITSVTALGHAGVADDIGPAVASLLPEDNCWINAQRIETACSSEPGQVVQREHEYRK
jgi:NAD(P)-dependent dehydrogenase (short-subunit alcohol dehydrogenase family)